MLVKQLDELGSVDEDTLNYAKEFVKNARPEQTEEDEELSKWIYGASHLGFLMAGLMIPLGYYENSYGFLLSGFAALCLAIVFAYRNKLNCFTRRTA